MQYHYNALFEIGWKCITMHKPATIIVPRSHGVHYYTLEAVAMRNVMLPIGQHSGFVAC